MSPCKAFSQLPFDSKRKTCRHWKTNSKARGKKCCVEDMRDNFTRADDMCDKSVKVAEENRMGVVR